MRHCSFYFFSCCFVIHNLEIPMKTALSRAFVPPTFTAMASQLMRACKAPAEVDSMDSALALYLRKYPVRFARVCARTADMCTSPERKATFLLEAVKRAMCAKQADWLVGFMVACVEKTQMLLAGTPEIDEKRLEILRERWRDAAIMIFHAAGYFRACAEIYQARAAAAANGTANREFCANEFMSAVEQCNAAFAQGIPETIEEAILRVKSAAGRLFLALANTDSDEYLRMSCFVQILRAEWLGDFYNPDSGECFLELKKLHEKAHGNFSDAFKTLTAAYLIKRVRGEWNNALSIAMEVAKNPHAHPDWRAEAYLVLVSAMEQSGFKKQAIEYIRSILNLPISGGHVAREISRRILRRIDQEHAALRVVRTEKNQ